ncbi:LysE family transporter, partial [Cupriavidus sp. SIMBA_020]|uniref:LysE family translocator n=1 Tax=Cupriavidus sp. SIMBA_020 TaxID=3085766 RepID=UPI00397DE329
RRAGLVSLGGVALGYVFYMFCAAFGITALLLTVPYAYDALRFGGALYLLYLAVRTFRSRPVSHMPDAGRARSPVREVSLQGLLTN